MLMKFGFTRYTRFSASDETYEFEIWLQPYHCWVQAQLYLLYDRAWYVIPGGRWLMRKIDSRRKNLWSESFMDLPWTVKRDLRVYDLFHKGRKVIAQNIALTEEQFQALRGFGEI